MNLRVAPSLILLLALSGCSLKGLPTSTAQTGGKEGSIRVKMPGGTVGKPGEQTVVTGGGLISNNGGSVISNGSASLAGQVLAPSGLLSNNGGGILSDNGLGYRTLALTQVPVKNTVVKLLDAAGQAVKGADGKALTTTTDGEGRYAFKTGLPNQTVLVEVAVGQTGSLRAIAPRDAGAKRTVDVELVSTLTTAYILDQFVKGQPDPVKTLEKLPGAVEAETRQSAAAAFEAAGRPTPTTLATAEVVATVKTLRDKAPTFDAQMEKVKQLLIAAGQSDLGNGQVATEVFLDPIQDVLVGADGSLYLHTAGNGFDVVWRVTPQGRLERLTAPGLPGTATVTDGQVAADARMGRVGGIALDDSNRLWINQSGPNGKLWRLSADRKTLQSVAAPVGLSDFVPTTGDGAIGLAYAKWGDSTALVELAAGQAAKELRRFSGADNVIVQSAQKLGRDAQGQLYLSGLISPSIIPKAYRLDPATGVLTLLKAAGQENVSYVTTDASGRLYYSQYGATDVKLRLPSGTETTLSGLGQPVFYNVIATGADGTTYLAAGANGASLYAVKDGQRKLYAGKEGQAPVEGADPTQLSLRAPTSLVVAPSGEFYLLDDGSVLKVQAPAGTTTLLAKGALMDGTAPLTPKQLQRGPDGALYVMGANPAVSFLADRPPLFKLVAGGAPQKLYTPVNELQAYAFGANGDIYLSEIRHEGVSKHVTRVLKRAADGTVTTLVEEAFGFVNQMELAVDAQGNLLMLGSHLENAVFTSNRIWRYKPGATPELLPASTPWPDAYDAQGRVYEGFRFSRQTEPGAIRRIDAVSGASETIAGVGGRFFTGTGVDDGVNKPVDPGFDGLGNLYFLDSGNKQVKRIPADSL
jgi:hypothetical protein